MDHLVEDLLTQKITTILVIATMVSFVISRVKPIYMFYFPFTPGRLFKQFYIWTIYTPLFTARYTDFIVFLFFLIQFFSLFSVSSSIEKFLGSFKYFIAITFLFLSYELIIFFFSFMFSDYQPVLETPDPFLILLSSFLAGMTPNSWVEYHLFGRIECKWIGIVQLILSIIPTSYSLLPLTIPALVIGHILGYAVSLKYGKDPEFVKAGAYYVFRPGHGSTKEFKGRAKKLN